MTYWKRPCFWERLKAGGEGDGRGWDGWMASPIQWTGTWVKYGSWWGRGRPGVLRSMELQRVGQDSNWTTPTKTGGFFVVGSKPEWIYILRTERSKGKWKVEIKPHEQRMEDKMFLCVCCREMCLRRVTPQAREEHPGACWELSVNHPHIPFNRLQENAVENWNVFNYPCFVNFLDIIKLHDQTMCAQCKQGCSYKPSLSGTEYF